MLANFFVSRRKSEETGYTNTSFRLQGVGLNGTIPVRVCYFGKQVMEPVMEKVIDASTGKPKLDKDGKELLVEKKDKDGNVIMAPKKDEKGNDVLRDENYADRVDLLSMFSGNQDDGHFTVKAWNKRDHYHPEALKRPRRRVREFTAWVLKKRHYHPAFRIK